MSAEPIVTHRHRRGRSGAGSLFALVVYEGRVRTLRLPKKPHLTIGRANDCDIAIDHPSLSREHARIHLRHPMAIEDLGSTNGTECDGVQLTPGEPYPLAVGKAFSVAEVTLLIQRQSNPLPSWSLRDHDYLESRAAEECIRLERSPFAIARLSIEHSASDAKVLAVFGHVLGPADSVARIGPRDFEILLAETPAAGAVALIDILAERLGNATTGIAFFPTDGTDPHTLIGLASSRAAGDLLDEPHVDGEVLVGAKLRGVYDIAARVAQGDISVLLVGETGVGKEVLAEHIHSSSSRAEGPFVRLNCAALSATLLESELFGHEKGAFTGASRTRAGLLEVGSGGTVFLDEIGEMPMAAQATLLRVLEQRQIIRVGGTAPIDIDVRFVAATNRDLEHEISAGAFRQDLYYRIAGATLAIPPLRERTDEIEGLVAMFLERQGAYRLSPAAIELLRAYHWPGNIRELRNVVERAALLCTGDLIDVEHLPHDRLRAGAKPSSAPELAEEADTAREAVVLDERAQIVDALRRCGGNQTAAAKVLGISRKTLGRRLDKFGLPRPRQNR